MSAYQDDIYIEKKLWKMLKKGHINYKMMMETAFARESAEISRQSGILTVRIPKTIIPTLEVIQRYDTIQ